MRWFRMYSEILDDSKLTEEFMPVDTFKTLIFLMAYASELNFCGIIPKENNPAWRIRITQKKLENHLLILENLGIITLKNGTISFKNWCKRQFESDNSTDRVKRFRNGQRNVSETPDETPPETETESETDTDTEKFKNIGRSLSIPERFEEFWKQYPRKEKKKNAAEAWSRLKLTDEDFSLVMASLSRQKMSDQWTRDGGKFIPHPTTWLNGRRWEDEGIQGDYAASAPGAPATKFEKNMAVLDKALKNAQEEKGNGGSGHGDKGLKSLGHDLSGTERERGVRGNLPGASGGPAGRGAHKSGEGMPAAVPVLSDDSGDQGTGGADSSGVEP